MNSSLQWSLLSQEADLSVFFGLMSQFLTALQVSALQALQVSALQTVCHCLDDQNMIGWGSHGHQ